MSESILNFKLVKSKKNHAQNIINSCVFREESTFTRMLIKIIRLFYDCSVLAFKSFRIVRIQHTKNISHELQKMNKISKWFCFSTIIIEGRHFHIISYNVKFKVIFKNLTKHYI